MTRRCAVLFTEMAAVKEEFRNILTEERETHKKEVEKLKQLMESKMAEQKREMESEMAEQKKEMKVHNQLSTALATDITCCDHTSAE